MGDQGCIVLADIENLVIPALRVCGGEGSTRDIAKKIARALIKKAQRFGSPVGFYGALSLPPVDASDLDVGACRRKAARKQIGEVLEAFVDLGFQVIVVPQGPDAADAALYEIGLRYIFDDKVTSVIIASGDGQGYFARLLNDAGCAGKRMHVVAYHRVPAGVKINHEVTASTLDAELQLSSSADELFTESACEDTSQGEGGGTVLRAMPSSLKELYVKAARDVYNGCADREDAKARLVADVAQMLEVELRRSAKPASVGNLLERILGAFKGIDSEEIKQALFAIMKTDFFEEVPMYRLRLKGGGRFREQARSFGKG